MESMNKFRALVILILGIFIFAIAAIYSNTKDVTDIKSKETIVKSEKTNSELSNHTIDETSIKERLDRLESLVKENNSGERLNCKIVGTRGQDGINEFSANEAIEDARTNQNDIIISCSLR